MASYILGPVGDLKEANPGKRYSLFPEELHISEFVTYSGPLSHDFT